MAILFVREVWFSWLSASVVLQNKNGCGYLLVDSREIEMSHGGRQG